MFGLKSVPVIQLPLCCGLWENCCVVENSCCVVKVLYCVAINLCCVVRLLCGVLCCGKCCCVVKNSCCVVRFSVWRCGRFMPPYSTVSCLISETESPGYRTLKTPRSNVEVGLRSFVLTQYQRVTDRQTLSDRQREGIGIALSRCTMQVGDKCTQQKCAYETI